MTKKQIISEMEGVSALEHMIETYEEIAASRMQKVRSFVLKNREFLSGITTIFQEVKTSYKNEVKRLIRKKKSKEQTTTNFTISNGKTVCVFLSANTGLYGPIVKETFKTFLNQIKENKTCDVTIIGKLGLALFLKESKMPYTYFDLPDGIIEAKDIANIAVHLIKYEDVVVFHGQYQSIIKQTPNVLKITADTASSGNIQNTEIKYIFEPSLEKIMTLFEAEIFSLIFEQTVHESQLAKFAARMVLLDSAAENTKEELKRLNSTKLRLQHNTINSQQLEKLTSMSLWK